MNSQQAKRIIETIDSLIEAKLSGVTDTDALADKTMGALGISRSTSIDSLMKLRDAYLPAAMAADASDDGVTYVLEE